MPGIFVQTLLFNGAATGIGMADDVQKGLFDRFGHCPCLELRCCWGGRSPT